MSIFAFVDKIEFDDVPEDKTSLYVRAFVRLLDTVTAASILIGVQITAGSTDLAATIKKNLSDQIVADATGYGFPLVLTGAIIYPDLSRG